MLLVVKKWYPLQKFKKKFAVRLRFRSVMTKCEYFGTDNRLSLSLFVFVVLILLMDRCKLCLKRYHIRYWHFNPNDFEMRFYSIRRLILFDVTSKARLNRSATFNTWYDTPKFFTKFCSSWSLCRCVMFVIYIYQLSLGKADKKMLFGGRLYNLFSAEVSS